MEVVNKLLKYNEVLDKLRHIHIVEVLDTYLLHDVSSIAVAICEKN